MEDFQIKFFNHENINISREDIYEIRKTKGKILKKR